MAFAGLSSLALAQTGPQLTVGPGVIYTVVSRTTVNLSTSSFNGIAYQNNGRQGIIYVSDAHSEGSISLANVYAIDLETGQVTRVAGTVPDHTHGNIADCATVGNPPQASCPGDGGPATSAQLHEPAGLALDSAGNLFIADDRQQVIRRVDASTGIITTIAGTGAAAYGGDGQQARNAALSFPIGIAFDSLNNLYIADSQNNRVRVINASNQVITTLAGTGTAGFASSVQPATSALLNRPFGVAVNRSGYVFIADSVNNAIREVADGLIYTVAGQGPGAPGYSGDGGAATAATLQYPISVAVDAGENLYIADDNNNVIRKVTGDASHTISTIAGQGPTAPGYSGDGGAAIKAALRNPTAIVMDGQSNLYFVDNQYGAVRRITATAAPLTLPLTGSTSTSAFPLTVSNTGDATLNISQVSFPSNFTAGSGGTCPAGPISLAPGASCTLPVSFTAGGSTSGALTFTSNTGNQSGATTNVTLSESNGLYFVPVSPCRVIDTRLSDPNFGGPAFSAGQTRNYAIRYSTGLGCAGSYIPANANVQAYSLNVTVVPPGPLTFLTVFPSGISLPNISTLNSYDGRIKANAAIVPANTGDANRGISIYASDPTHVIVDINGYYVPETDPPANNNNQTPLAYYPLPPCRSVDTRTGSGLLGSGAPLLGGTTTNYTLAGTCGLPAGAQAYALNYTALPRNHYLFYITTWPTGGTQPIVSTLNATTGTFTANAAIVPAPASANGSVSVYTTDDIDLLIDVAGYYAPPSANGLALYNLTPCRVYDSRFAGGAPGTGAPLNGNATFNANIGSSCGASTAAQSYVLNTTVLPANGHPLQYLTAWGQGSGQPLQSVLNAFDGAVTSNLAVVPTVNGYVSTYVTESTGLILDLSAYFAP